jgi:Mg2+ and Co2+ transporter CorA
MIWTYTCIEGKLQAKDVDLLSEIKKIGAGTTWLWIDCVSPTDTELQTIAKFIGENRIIEIVKAKQLLSQYERINEHVLIPSVIVDFKDKLETHLIHIVTDKLSLITIRDENGNRPIKNTIRIFQDCLKKLKCETSSSFAISRLLNEITNENLNAIMMLRNRISETEEKVLAKPANEQIDKVVFKLKREIAALERILWIQREILLAIEEGIVPNIEYSEMDRPTLRHTINNVARELSLISSHNNALDGILSVRGLGLIHRVEKMLILLAVITLVTEVTAIVWEFGILSFV